MPPIVATSSEAFGGPGATGEPIGEIWFEQPNGADAELLVKFLFTSERLSIQVHPDDRAARAAGLPWGKDEAWLILAAEPGAQIGLGTRKMLSKEELGRAAEDGSIVDLMDWRPVEPGQLIYSPAGTIHAIGAGVSLIEVQQNCDVTYRIYDYGRPRELQVEQAIAAARPVPFVQEDVALEQAPGRTVEAHGRAFVVERWRGFGDASIRPQARRPLWLVPIIGGGTLGGKLLETGSAWMVHAEAELSLPNHAEALIAYAGAGIIPDLVEPKQLGA